MRPLKLAGGASAGHRLASLSATAIAGTGSLFAQAWKAHLIGRGQRWGDDPSGGGGGSGGDDGDGVLSKGERLFFILASVALVLLAGLMSGLTLGLMSLDVVDLQVILRSGSEREKRYARKIAPVREERERREMPIARIRLFSTPALLPLLPHPPPPPPSLQFQFQPTPPFLQVVKHPHFLLVTLVFCNAFATETLPIFLDRLTSPLAAVALSMSVVLLFGEVIPQAVCSRYGLAVGAQAAWLVKILMVVSYPVAAPLAYILDRTLGGGDHAGAGGSSNPPSALFRRAQLKALVDVHAEDEGLGGNLTVDEVAVIRGALDLSAKTASCCLTPIERVFALPTDARLDGATLRAIVASGHSRVPVHSPGDKEAIVGVILVKELLTVDRDFDDEDEDEGGEGGEQESEEDKERRRESRRRRLPPLVAELKLRTLPHLRADTKLYDMLRLFETGRCHMAVLVTPPRPLGSVKERGGGGGGDGGSEDDFDDDDDDDEEEEEERRTRVPMRDFSDDASDGAASAVPAPLAPSRPSSVLPVPSFPSNQSRSALAEVLVARGDRLTPRSAAAASSSLQTRSSGGGGERAGEAAKATAKADAPPPVEQLPPPSPTGSSSSSSSVEDALGGRVLGIVTIEDVLEELIGHAILDETDRFEDRHGERRVNARALAASLPSHLRELLREHQIRVGGGGDGGLGRGSTSGYGVGQHFHSHVRDGRGGSRSGSGSGGGDIGNGLPRSISLGGSRLLPPAARQAVIGNISDLVPPHDNTSRVGAASSPLAAAVAARRSRGGGSIEGGGSPSSSLLRQPLLTTTAATTAAGASFHPPPPQAPAAKRWT